MTQKTLILTICVCVVISLGFAAKPPTSTNVQGYVLDSACAFTKDLNKPISRDCALACAKAGSPLVILTKEGTVYWPIDSATPSASQNEKLVPFAGNQVSVTGKIYMRGGSKAIVIEKIEALK